MININKLGVKIMKITLLDYKVLKLAINKVLKEYSNVITSKYI